jgi:polar amino acid transport system substrate-binding protein
LKLDRWFLLFAVVPLLALTLVACGDDDDDDGGDGGDADYELVSEGVLTVCTDSPYPPFEFEENGEFTGFDMDLLREIAEHEELELDVKVVPFDGIWLLPAAGECDIVGSAMTITEERAEQALFSDPYFDADQSLLVRAEDAETFATLESLAGERIGVQTGTTGEAYAQENTPDGATLVSFDEPAALFLALESGDIAAILQDLPVNGYRQVQDESMVVTETFPTGEQYGFAVALDNEALIAVVNEQLEHLRDEGTYDEIYATWFGD